MKLGIYLFNLAVLLSAVIDLRSKASESRLPLALVRILFIVPSLIATYLLVYFYTEDYVHPYFYYTESVFALLSILLAARYYHVTSPNRKEPVIIYFLFIIGSSIVMIKFGHDIVRSHTASLANGVLIFSFSSFVYFSALFLVVAILVLGWQLEAFWRSLDMGDKFRYKYLTIGQIFVCIMLGWSCSYRLAYLRIPRDHFLLLAIVLAAAWLAMGYALAKHRLLNRKLFVSRKVVYASITPIAFSIFFIFIGLMSLLSRIFNWTVPLALKWMFVALGSIAIIILSLSSDVRRRIKYFISTHFYVNKYEYRDEWLAFSDLLQGRLTEKGVVDALYQILRDCLYTRNILIWLGDIRKGFRLIDMKNEQGAGSNEVVDGDDAIVCYLHNAPYLYSWEGDDDPLRRSILKERGAFFKEHDIVLVVPLILGSQCVGMIGLGAESTGGRYGHDDFDLLAALSSHAASALLAIQNAEKLARAREQSAWSNLSAFVLHDIKNAASILDLARNNAPQHIDKPKFQKDMLESIDDALKRMAKVQDRLSVLKGKIDMEIRTVDLGDLLSLCAGRLAKKLPGLDLVVNCPLDLSIRTDEGFIYQILENLLINAYRAGGERTAVRIEVQVGSMIWINLQDDGPGIQADLLPQALFEPFKTANPDGSGIGLWQVRELVESLGGDIQARNISAGGAQFTLSFPYDSSLSSIGNVKNSNTF